MCEVRTRLARWMVEVGSDAPHLGSRCLYYCKSHAFSKLFLENCLGSICEEKIPLLEGHGERHFCHFSCAGRKYLCLGWEVCLN